MALAFGQARQPLLQIFSGSIMRCSTSKCSTVGLYCGDTNWRLPDAQGREQWKPTDDPSPHMGRYHSHPSHLQLCRVRLHNVHTEQQDAVSPVGEMNSRLAVTCIILSRRRASSRSPRVLVHRRLSVLLMLLLCRLVFPRSMAVPP